MRICNYMFVFFILYLTLHERPKLLCLILIKQPLIQSIISWIQNSPGRSRELASCRTCYLKTSMFFSATINRIFSLNVNTHNFLAFVLWLICKNGFSSFCYLDSISIIFPFDLFFFCPVSLADIIPCLEEQLKSCF